MAQGAHMIDVLAMAKEVAAHDRYLHWHLLSDDELQAFARLLIERCAKCVEARKDTVEARLVVNQQEDHRGE